MLGDLKNALPSSLSRLKFGLLHDGAWGHGMISAISGQHPCIHPHQYQTSWSADPFSLNPNGTGSSSVYGRYGENRKSERRQARLLNNASGRLETICGIILLTHHPKGTRTCHAQEWPLYADILDTVYGRDTSWRLTFSLESVFHEPMPCNRKEMVPSGQWATRGPYTSSAKFPSLVPIRCGACGPAIRMDQRRFKIHKNVDTLAEIRTEGPAPQRMGTRLKSSYCQHIRYNKHKRLLLAQCPRGGRALFPTR